jgi:hypothetical protein
MKMHLVTLAGLAIGSAVFSGCANRDSTSYSGQQQNTLVANARDQGVTSPEWVNWTKDRRSQKSPPAARSPTLTVLGNLDATTDGDSPTRSSGIRGTEDLCDGSGDTLR